MPNYPDTYTLEHFYWGKLIIDKLPEGGYRVLATSSYWDKDRANMARMRVYLGSHNNLQLQPFNVLISINSEEATSRSHMLIAFVNRSDYIDRSEHYPEYHIMRLPHSLVAAYDHNYVHLVTSLHALHQRQVFQQLQENLAPVIYKLPSERTDLQAPCAYILQMPFIQDNQARRTIMTHLLNDGHVVFTQNALDTVTALYIISGFKQLLPPSTRWRISGAVGVFQSRESPCNLHFLYDEERSKIARDSLIIDQETGVIIEHPETRPIEFHPYTRLLDIALGDMSSALVALQNIFSSFEALYDEQTTHSQEENSFDWLESASYRLLYDEKQLSDDVERVFTLQYLLRTPFVLHQQPTDLRDIFQLALQHRQSSWLDGLYDKLRTSQDVDIWVQEQKPRQAVIDLCLDAYNNKNYSLAQWLLIFISEDDYLCRIFIQRNSETLIFLLHKTLTERYEQDTIKLVEKYLNNMYQWRQEHTPMLVDAILQTTLHRENLSPLIHHWLSSPSLVENLRHQFIEKTRYVELTATMSAQALLKLSSEYWRLPMTDACFILKQTPKSTERDDFFEFVLKERISSTNTLNHAHIAIEIQALGQAYHTELTSTHEMSLTGGYTWTQFHYQLEQIVAFFDQLLAEHPNQDMVETTHLSSQIGLELLEKFDELRRHLAIFEKKGLFGGKHTELERIQTRLWNLHQRISQAVMPEDVSSSE